VASTPVSAVYVAAGPGTMINGTVPKGVSVADRAPLGRRRVPAAVRSPLNAQKLSIFPPKPAPQMARAPNYSCGVRIFWQAKTCVTPIRKYGCRMARPIGYPLFHKPIRMLSRDLALRRPGPLRVLSQCVCGVPMSAPTEQRRR
jgi:hypothetical protein